MLTKLLAMTKAELKSKIQSIDESAIKGRALRRQLAGMKKKEGGFTLLELLVVVAILAAIAGTATIMLQDTDRKGAAAAHVAMMDELSKGIQTFRVLNQGAYPNNWDSLLSSGADIAADGDPATASTELAILENALAGMVTPGTLTAPQVAALSSVGIDRLRYINGAAAGCEPANIRATVLNKQNDVTAQNIFRIPTANGCGTTASAAIGTVATTVALWTGANERVNAPAGDVLLAVGAGPDSNLFNPSIIGALSNVPVYRHVAPGEYNRFIVLWNVGTATGPASGQATFQAIIDGAGDTKDEELGEVDNVRAT